MSEINGKTPRLTRSELRDLRVLAQFTSVYCRVHHVGKTVLLDEDVVSRSELNLKKYPLCPECRNFLSYAMTRRMRCPLDPKPDCKHCDVHCYRLGHREKVREIMRFSGKYLILRGRVDLLWHYFF